MMRERERESGGGGGPIESDLGSSHTKILREYQKKINFHFYSSLESVCLEIDVLPPRHVKAIFEHFKKAVKMYF